MHNKNFVEGINIISKYIPETETFSIGADHDILWFGDYNWVTNKEDVQRLLELGWFESDHSWSCFV